ncbi:hypothetical protein [Paenibacillus sp. FSL W8-0194]|uniref:DUF6843 domain-containing protein n=1 Tax=Paenibacillus sp. FSL W8-0194 TaxID=2921711 RepID=UPI0030DC2540
MSSNRRFISGTIFTAIGVSIMLGITVASLTKTTTTDDLFLIPEGFEGNIQVNYNVAGAPRLEKEGKYDVIPIRADGTYDTSNPDMDYGTVTDQYYYVGQDGKRTPIPENCIHVKGNGASEIGSNITRHQYLKVTRTTCSENFRVWGEETDGAS